MARNAWRSWGGLLAAAAVVAGCAQTKQDAGTSASVSWHTSYDAALADAGKSGRPILLDFYTDW